MRLNKKYLYKTITWRMISIVTSFALSYWIMGSIEKSLTFTAIYSIISSVLYYIHEEIYRRIKHRIWGYPKPKETKRGRKRL